MLYSLYTVKDAIRKIGVVKKKIKKEDNDINFIKFDLLKPIRDIQLGFKEFQIIRDGNSGPHDILIYITGELVKKINKWTSETEPDEIKEEIDDFTKNFENFDYAQNDVLSHYASYYNKSNSAPAIGSVDCCVSAVNRNREFNYLELEAGEGHRIRSVLEINPKALGYIITSKESKTQELREIERMERVGLGEVLGSRISNDAFDVILTRCDIKHTLDLNMVGGHISKHERFKMLQADKYLRKGGYHILVLPYYRLHSDFSGVLARNYSEIDIFRGHTSRDEKYQLLYLIAKKAEVRGENPATIQKLLNINNFTDATPVDRIDKEFTLPLKRLDINDFKGSKLDSFELHNLISSSNMVNEFKKMQEVTLGANESKHPLLPFNIGQLGLVLTS